MVGPRGIVPSVDAAPLLRDERRLYQGAAALVVRPGSTEEFAAVVRVCHDAHIGVVPQGGNTGYCGGATPFDGERRQILLSLTRLNRVTCSITGLRIKLFISARNSELKTRDRWRSSSCESILTTGLWLI